MCYVLIINLNKQKTFFIVFLNLLLHFNYTYAQERINFGKTEINQILRAHNSERQLVGVPDLVWDEELAQYAYTWAENLARHNAGIWHRTQTGKHYGENIAMFSGYQFSANRGVDLWNDEKRDYTYSPISSTEYKVTGHYTQVVWSSTKRVGCGCARSTGGAYYFVCNYDPPGNYIGQYPYQRNQSYGQNQNDAQDQLNHNENSAEKESEIMPDEIPEPEEPVKPVVNNSPDQGTRNISGGISAADYSNQQQEIPAGAHGKKHEIGANVKENRRKNKIENSEILSIKVSGLVNLLSEELSVFSEPFDSKSLFGSATLFIGYRYGSAVKKSAFGLFGTFGQYSAKDLNTILSSTLNQYPQNYYELEGGIIFGELLRIGGGKGWIATGGPESSTRDYYIVTMGLSVGPKRFKFEFVNSLILSQSQTQVLWRPSLGLSFKIDFLKQTKGAH